MEPGERFVPKCSVGQKELWESALLEAPSVLHKWPETLPDLVVARCSSVCSRCAREAFLPAPPLAQTHCRLNAWSCPVHQHPHRLSKGPNMALPPSQDERVRALNLSEKELRELSSLSHYIWWKSRELTMERPDLLIAKIMNVGDYDDVCRMIDIVGTERLLYVLQHAEAGQFDPPSWSYWHYRLTDIELGEVPPLPVRRFHD